MRRDLHHLVTDAQRWLEAGDHFQVLVHVLNIADALQADGRTEAAQRLRTAANDPLTAAQDKPAAFHRVVALAAHLTAPGSAQDARATAQGA